MAQWIVWPMWLLACIGAFAWFEIYALKHPERQWTLSHFMATLGAYFPLSLVIFGIIVGALVTHFFGGSWNCGGGLMPASWIREQAEICAHDPCAIGCGPPCHATFNGPNDQ